MAHFFHIESRRKDLDQRGLGKAHEQFDIPNPRDGEPSRSATAG